MKGTIFLLLCFALGVGLGRMVISPPTAEVGEEPRSGPGGTAPVIKRPGKSSRLERESEGLEVSRERIVELAVSGRSPALSANDFLRDERASLELLATWLELDQSEKEKLAGILEQAARDRVGWEETHVRVKRNGPKWTLDFPSDGGEARDSLKAALAGSFTPAKARAIDMMGDLDNFFGFGNYAAEFRHGEVQISVQRINQDGVPADKGLEDEYEIYMSSPWVKHREGVIANEPLEMGAMKRFAGLLKR